MEPTSAQRKAVFVLVVLVLAGLGTYLFVPSAFGAFRSGPARPAGSSAASTARPAGPPSASVPGTGSPAPTQTPTPGPTRSAAPDIYQWLPFTSQELGAAASTVTAFGNAYGTYSYSENTASYLSGMRNMITPALSSVIARGYAAPGVASQRVSQKQVATAAAAIRSLRAFGGSSLTFVVTISQQVTDTQGTSKNTMAYAVTVTGGGNSWQVSDIELAGAGNQ